MTTENHDTLAAVEAALADIHDTWNTLSDATLRAMLKSAMRTEAGLRGSFNRYLGNDDVCFRITKRMEAACEWTETIKAKMRKRNLEA